MTWRGKRENRKIDMTAVRRRNGVEKRNPGKAFMEGGCREWVRKRKSRKKTEEAREFSQVPVNAESS